MENKTKIRQAPQAPSRSTPSPNAQVLQQLFGGTLIPCEFKLPQGETVRFGKKTPLFSITFHNTRVFSKGFDEFSFSQSYIQGEIDIEGDLAGMLDLRTRLNAERTFIPSLKLLIHLLMHSPVAKNREHIEAHYGHGEDLYLNFLDSKYHLYSHGLFRSDEETLEQAGENKLRNMYDSLQLKPGTHLLDIGAGWGGVVDYCGSRGVRVTALTLHQDSYEFMRELIREKNLPCEVYLEDFLTHRPKAPYEAINNFGVIEHIPQYRRFFEQVWDCLQPGGLFYLDASATREKYDKAGFVQQYVWQGPHTFMCLQNLIQELLFQGMDLLQVENESRDYERTLWHWAKNLDAHKNKIGARLEETLYRTFRLFLWGGYHAFKNDTLQAYHLLARRGPKKGPRPNLARRILHFIREQL